MNTRIGLMNAKNSEMNREYKKIDAHIKTSQR